MGTHVITEHIPGHSNPDKALRSMIEQDRDEYGHNHSWSVLGVEVLSGPTFTSLAYEQLANTDARWNLRGTARAIEVYHAHDVETRTVEVTETFTGEQWADGGQDAALRTLGARARLRAGEAVTDVRIATREERVQGRLYPTTIQQIAAKFKTVVTAPKEKTETRYFLIDQRSKVSDLDWDRGFASQAAARAAATDAITNGHSRERVLDVIGISRRVSGAPLVRVERQVTKVTLTASVTISRAKKDARTDGYVITAAYHS